MTDVVDYDGRFVPDGAASLHFDGRLASPCHNMAVVVGRTL
jgi:hypothetical protein